MSFGKTLFKCVAKCYAIPTKLYLVVLYIFHEKSGVKTLLFGMHGIGQTIAIMLIFLYFGFTNISLIADPSVYSFHVDVSVARKFTKGESVVVVILLSHLEASYCTSVCFRS